MPMPMPTGSASPARPSAGGPAAHLTTLPAGADPRGLARRRDPRLPVPDGRQLPVQLLLLYRRPGGPRARDGRAGRVPARATSARARQPARPAAVHVHGPAGGGPGLRDRSVPRGQRGRYLPREHSMRRSLRLAAAASTAALALLARPAVHREVPPRGGGTSGKAAAAARPPSPSRPVRHAQLHLPDAHRRLLQRGQHRAVPAPVVPVPVLDRQARASPSSTRPSAWPRCRRTARTTRSSPSQLRQLQVVGRRSP